MGSFSTKCGTINDLSRNPEFYSQHTKNNVYSQNSPQEMVEIFVGLKNIDNFSKYIIQVQISDDEDSQMNQSKTYINLGSTLERQGNNNTINFENSFVFPYCFELEQILRFKIIQNSFSSKMMMIETIVGKLMGSKSQLLELNLNQQGIVGDLIIKATTVKNSNILAKMSFSVKLNSDYKEPYFIIKRDIRNSIEGSFNNNNNKGEETFVYENNNWLNVYKSEVLPHSKQSVYNFIEVTIHNQLLCNGNLSKPILIEFYDYYYRKSLGHTAIFLDKFSFNNTMKYNLYNESRTCLPAELNLKCNLIREYKFLDYLRGGLQISLIIGIDFTQSNGDPLNVNSLHYIGGNPPNSYEKAIKSCGEIVAYYDADQLFPVYGYGALLPGYNGVNHCFNVNFQVDPNVHTIDGVLTAYRNSIRNIRLYGPTCFAPIIQKTIQHCYEQKNEHIYFILLILTDGIINDMNQTIDALVEASFLPISVIIVGIGNADFSNMDTLDADDTPLYNSKGVKAARDLVQFVPFGKMENNGKKLASEVLEEVPRQIEEYFRMQKIPPRDPIL